MKTYEATIYFSPCEIRVKAKNVTEARKKALAKLSKKNPVGLVQTRYDTGRREIFIDELL
jgi:hypothetical protein